MTCRTESGPWITSMVASRLRPSVCRKTRTLPTDGSTGNDLLAPPWMVVPELGLGGGEGQGEGQGEGLYPYPNPNPNPDQPEPYLDGGAGGGVEARAPARGEHPLAVRAR